MLVFVSPQSRLTYAELLSPGIRPLAILDNLKEKFSDTMETTTTASNISKVSGGVLLGLLGLIGVTGFFWDNEPDLFDVNIHATEVIEQVKVERVTGSTTVATMIQLMDVLLHKRGGYLTNDIMPPGVWMDNVPNWEFGVLVQIRDMARSLRNNMSRSQSQSTEDKGLVTHVAPGFFED